jgi:divalent metal cation (Fe/Co/Zn/Cd) transporter
MTRAEGTPTRVGQRGEGRLILLALLKDGPLTAKEIEQKTLAFVSNFEGLGDVIAQKLHLKSSGRERIRRHDKKYDAKAECERLASQGMIRLNEGGRYELTREGEMAAKASAKQLEGLLSPQTAAKNTAVADFFLATMKLLVGLLSGSVGLLADGADATVDTASAAVVWVGLRVKKEVLGTLLIVAMMFMTACTIGYESVTKLIDAVERTLLPISGPHLVIAVEAAALLSAVLLYLYQRAAGRRNGSLALISQSVDSRNHIFVSLAVITGAAFSIVGILFVDALIGAFIAARFAWDGFGLSREALSSMRGEELHLSEYRLPLEKSWRTGRLETFREWILYSVKEEKLRKKDEIIDSLERAFRPQYIPIVSEFRIGGEPFNFNLEFDKLVQPLLEKGLLAVEGNEFSLTDQGQRWVANSSRTLRYRRNE